MGKTNKRKLSIVGNIKLPYFSGNKVYYLKRGSIIIDNVDIPKDLLNLLREKMPIHDFKIAFDKNMEVLLRLNGFFIGAIGINMIITAILNII